VGHVVSQVQKKGVPDLVDELTACFGDRW